MMRGLLVAGMVLASSCMRVVEETTTYEVLPARYAVLEFTPAVIGPDSAEAFARRALTAEGLTPRAGKPPVQVEATSLQIKQHVIEGGPVHFDASGELPALDATVAVTTFTPEGQATRFRVHASATLPKGATGGIDPRLMEVVQRVSSRIQSMISP